MYQLLCFCSFLAKHQELLNLIHIYQRWVLWYPFYSGFFVFTVQNYGLEEHFKGHKRHTDSEDLLYSVSNMIVLCF